VCSPVLLLFQEFTKTCCKIDRKETKLTLHLIFGGAGFIGSNLARHLLAERDSYVICVDNFSRGQISFVRELVQLGRFDLIEADISDYDVLNSTMEAHCVNIDEKTVVWHLAANSDIPAGVGDIAIDFKDTFQTTVSILRWMKNCNLKKLCFASSSAIYGDHGVTYLHESIGDCLPVSNYGAMKLASEAAICAAQESFLSQAIVFRFPNVVGTPATHGVIYDFIHKIKLTPELLNVLGDGSQKKLYLHVSDLISAMIFLQENLISTKKIEIFNIGPPDQGASVKEIAEIVSALFNPRPAIRYGIESKGWVGDVPKFRYSTKKLNDLGWNSKLGSLSAIRLASKEILQQIVGN